MRRLKIGRSVLPPLGDESYLMRPSAPVLKLDVTPPPASLHGAQILVPRARTVGRQCVTAQVPARARKAHAAERALRARLTACEGSPGRRCRIRILFLKACRATTAHGSCGIPPSWRPFATPMPSRGLRAARDDAIGQACNSLEHAGARPDRSPQVASAARSGPGTPIHRPQKLNRRRLGRHLGVKPTRPLQGAPDHTSVWRDCAGAEPATLALSYVTA